MDKIKKYEEYLLKLQPIRGIFIDECNRLKQEFSELINTEHDYIGRVLKSHLIIEHYLDQYLFEKHSIQTKEANLRFYNKIKIIPQTDLKMILLGEAILEVNQIRNKLGHHLNDDFLNVDVKYINVILYNAKIDISSMNVVDRIEAFTPICCAHLSHNSFLEKITNGEFRKIIETT